MFPSDVKWLKFPVDLPLSAEVMSMRYARRNGRSARDLLFGIWMDLFALAGRLNENGRLLRGGTVMQAHDFAEVFGRRIGAVEYALEWLLQIGMLTIDGETGAYAIPCWSETQSTEKLKRLRKTRVAKVCDENAPHDLHVTHREEEIRKDKNREDKIREEKNREEKIREEETAVRRPESRVDEALRKSLEEKERRRKNPELDAQYKQKQAEFEEARRRREAEL